MKNKLLCALENKFSSGNACDGASVEIGVVKPGHTFKLAHIQWGRSPCVSFRMGQY